MDYLENHLAPRLEVERENLLARGDKNWEMQEGSAERDAGRKEGRKIKEEQQAAFAGADYQEELENLLKEFFA